jgi:acyl-coenzyme A synthetase/AMP-(fatty) acid ligase
MSAIAFLLDVFRDHAHQDAFVYQGKSISYQHFLELVNHWQEYLVTHDVPHGTVTVLEADFSPDAAALFLALTAHGCIIVPISGTAAILRNDFIATAQGERSFALGADGRFAVAPLPYHGDHKLYAILKNSRHPGLVFFSSGSTGKPKAAVHDLTALLEKFKVPRRSLRTLAFLLFDHIGGINTLFYTLSNAGCLVIVRERKPDTVMQAIERYGVELLPTTPTFINLMLLSEYRNYDLSSLKMVTYGTEPMLESTLKRFHRIFPQIKLQQTYGLSEIGIMRSKSAASDSLLMKIGGEDFQTRVVDGILQVKARSAMLGYLNAPSPFTDDGWFVTGDEVVVDGQYLRILGRHSDIINVGGMKVYPAEVESVIQEMPGVQAATVYGEKNPLIGQIVCARVTATLDQDAPDFPQRLRKFCRERLEGYKVPVRINVVADPQCSERFKKPRLINQ